MIVNVMMDMEIIRLVFHYSLLFLFVVLIMISKYSNYCYLFVLLFFVSFFTNK